MMVPSLPSSPATEATATTFNTQIMFPAFAPAICIDKASVLSSPTDSATFIVRLENIIFEKVADPETNAPRAPIHGATSGHTPPNVSAAAVASSTGIDASPAPPFSEWMKIRTIGTDAANVMTVPTIPNVVALKTDVTCDQLMLCKKNVEMIVKMNMNPGE